MKIFSDPFKYTPNCSQPCTRKCPFQPPGVTSERLRLRAQVRQGSCKGARDKPRFSFLERLFYEVLVIQVPGLLATLLQCVMSRGLAFLDLPTAVDAQHVGVAWSSLGRYGVEALANANALPSTLSSASAPCIGVRIG